MKYNLFNEVLLNLREAFHKSGRFDDSNAKLDEIIKLLVISFYEAKFGNRRFNLQYLEERALGLYNSKEQVASALRSLFEEISKDEIFVNTDKTNIFGSNPTLNIQASENEFAIKLVSELGKLDFTDIVEGKNSSDFDLINECFSHFVRENFRNNKEDAQYMTPKEIVEPILKMVFSDIINENEFINRLRSDKPFIIMDPTCGVGTLVIEALRYLIHHIQKLEIDPNEREVLIEKLKKTSIVGQDKVDRMVRFSKINAMLMGCDFSRIYHGNSILAGSMLDEYIGKVSLIITNPPFGAAYGADEVKDELNYSIVNKMDGVNINSELLMLDRSLKLLEPNGRMVIILPDSVVSAKGIYSKFREELLKTCTIKSIIELPSITFAQAGTRTKTVIIYLQKKEVDLTVENSMFMSVCNDIGFDVKERKGVPVKIEKGVNEMESIADSYIRNREKLYLDQSDIINVAPSCTKIINDDVIDDFLTPSFYSAVRLEILLLLKGFDNNKFDLVSLEDIAELDSKNRKRKKLLVSEDVKHISLLHINKDNTIDFKEVEEFNPVSKGVQCFENEVLFAKLNPRIPRITVIPEYHKDLVCSNEFEILVPKNGISPYLLTVILDSDIVKKQIQSLTAGTSSSHNRIKQEQLREITIPIPKKESELYEVILNIGEETEEAIKLKYEAEYRLNNQKEKLLELSK
ncbi:N-6 DNA methylase [Bacillus paranthracis]|uniref:N-6 DNA methylase n=1 Tax=Bacillus paranthracis TaxID=2026186 RepID=UPI001C12C6F3|nr:N-6 DNA methylase [Bacillus paranthracis]